MKRRGFTLVELLVVIAIIALLMGILMPALARVRALAHRVVCGTNLSGIGKGMLMYSTDYDEDYPRAGGKRSYWGDNGWISRWDSSLREADAFGSSPSGAKATITSSFYLLIRYAGAQTKQFVCNGDVGTKRFELSYGALIAQKSGPVLEDVSEAWDFGTQPALYCSYSYHLPYDSRTTAAGYPITAVSNARSPLCADRNPYLDRNAVPYLDVDDDEGEAPSWDTANDEYYDPDKRGNAAAHQQDGQNVLYNDSHVKFEMYPNVGIAKDNIWKHWPPNVFSPTRRQRELDSSPPEEAPTTGAGVEEYGPVSEKDAYLVSEDQRVVGPAAKN